jgi:hypothetical protein
MVGSYRFDIGENFDLKPGLLVNSTDWKSYYWSSMILIMFKERFWGGLSYTSNECIGAMAGFDIKSMLRIGYSLDYITSELNHDIGSHEIILALMLK